MAIILLVDDCPLIQRIYGDFLRGRGHEVACTGTPFGVLNSIRAVNPDVVLVDINLPGMNGGRLSRLIRGHSGTRVIGISGSEEEELKSLVREGTIRDFFLKNSPLNDLAAKIGRAVTVPA